LGLFSFGLLTKYEIKEKWVWLVAVISVLMSYLINSYSVILFSGYNFGYEILILNGLFTYVGLFLIRHRKHQIKN
jgi:hypothetical protein